MDVISLLSSTARAFPLRLWERVVRATQVGCFRLGPIIIGRTREHPSSAGEDRARGHSFTIALCTPHPARLRYRSGFATFSHKGRREESEALSRGADVETMIACI